ncbi:PREDICTED: polycomb protein Scm-like isoform X2 [Dinoponera quadriceps]|uniref:Polycomb protein Scm-like isoform X2 n=1 Tax=Dinoponera quadriceps TaxID=609295 RepID=A0A6P3XME5_DINQU|nr:PREDICTED: polycomb protein Scm-like isoform X2 [Dinoponera quadriceps]
MQPNPVDSQIGLEQHILEAIDQLRSRKARPDADRICNLLLRKYSVDARDTIADLHRLIEVEKVIQVDYKGHTSYRNASKWSRLQLYKNRPEGFIKEKLNSGMISTAVSELVVGEPDYLDQGVPASRLIEQLLDGKSSPTSRRMVEEFLNKEVSCGNLTRLSNGNYTLVATSDVPTTPDDAPRRDSATSSTTDDVTPAAASRSQQNGNSSATRRLGKGNAAVVAAPVKTPGSCSSSSRSSSRSSNGSAVVRRRKKPMMAEAATTTTTACAAATTTATLSVGLSTVATTAAAAAKTLAAAAAELLYEFDDTDNPATDSGDSNTPRLSRQTSPAKMDQPEDPPKKTAEIVKSDEPMECDDNQERVPVPPPVSLLAEQSPKCNEVAQTTPNLKRPTKAERKQRLFARTEDPMDMKFEDDPRDNKEELEALKEKRDEADRRSSDDREDEEAGRSSTNTSPTPCNVNASGFRSARRKRAKKVFDPSDNNLVKRKRGRQPGSHNKNTLTQDSQDIAKVLIKDGPCRQCSLCAKEKQEALVACRDCTVRAHPSCIYSPEEMLQKANSNWQCERCKSCTVCCETSDAKQYKANIVSQNANSINTSRPNTPSNTPVLPPVLSPQVSPARGSDHMEDDAPRDKIDPNIPDASDWSSEQVYQYFARLFPKEAEVFRHQEIDGHSLLLLRRSDVLTGLDLLLGPALKIYRHVLKLQVRRDDPKLYWL